MKLCSVLIPTRKRVPRLLKAIESIRGTSKPENVDIWLRMDTDDWETINALPEVFRRAGHVRVLIGPRLSGHASLCEFYDELVRACDSTWVLTLNDDITLEGHGWDEKLAKLPTYCSVAWGDKYHLGNSLYTSKDCAFVCPFVPRAAWLEHGPTQNPVDILWLEKAQRLGWGTHTIPGLTINHQRDDSATLELHRS